MKITSRLLMIAAIAGLLAPASAGAADRPLPDFEVTSADAGTVSSAALGDASHWLLIYIQPDCAPCDAVADLWSDAKPPAPASRVRVVVAATSVERLPQVQARYPMLAGAAWYADSTGAAGRALGLTGAPALLGVRGETIAWTSLGLLPITRSQISGWIR
jgi:hypothetical protein